MLRRAAERPGGRLSEVFESKAELQAAYDFVESDIDPRALVEGFADATVRAARDLPFVYVVVDGTSLSLTDRQQTKDFGSIGQRAFPTRGLKVIDALAVAPDGAPIGLLDVHFWARKPKATRPRFMRRRLRDTETTHWVEVLERLRDRMVPSLIRPWFVIDREGDCAEMLRALDRPEVTFTVRSNQDRRLSPGSSRNHSLRAHMRNRPVLGRHFVNVPSTDGQPSRIARLDMRIGRVVLDLPNHAQSSRARTSLAVHVLWLRERHPPRGRAPVDWMLLTNHSMDDHHDALAVLESYCHRWRIEDFHRAWKRGRCFVEETQLRRRITS
ncbi:MAG: hypothetical protein JWM74_5724 [Myxococcaceae bacterium]|nr:hypothetical protein [Myxococcaceae bacterium]